MISSKQKPNKSFRRKLLTTLHAGLISGLLLTGTCIAIVQVYIANENLKADLETVAKIIGDRSVAALVFDDRVAAVQNLQAARFHTSLVSICLYQHNGELFSFYETMEGDNSCKKSITVPASSKQWLSNGFSTLSLLTLIESGGQPQGWIYLKASTNAIQQTLLIFILITAIVLIVVSIASSALTRTMLQRVMTPLENLHNTAKTVSGDILSQQRAPKINDDEIGELVDVFNQMLDSISSETLALATSEERFRTLTAGAPIGIFQLDRNLTLQYTNEKWQQITGISSLGNAFEIHKTRIHKDDISHYHEFWRTNLTTSSSNLMEYRYRHAGINRPHYFMEYVSPLLGPDKEKNGYIGTLLDVTELKDAQIELEKLAYYDPLTDLPNRRFFRDHLDLKLAEAKRIESMFAVMMIDLDNFKKINDTLGHDAGDELLQIISRKLKYSVRDQDVVSRMGGDEFLVLLTSVENSTTVSTLAQRVQNSICEPHRLGNQTMEINASIGIAIYPDDGTSNKELLKNADIALYHAKELGRQRISFFSKELDQRIRENTRIESRLKHALENGILELYLQPQFSSQTMQMVWSEALLRWHDGAMGHLGPAKFIPVAEEAGLIHRVGHYVLERTCFELSEHGKYLARLGIKGISINLSAPQLYSKQLVADIRHTVNEFNIDPGSLEIEITESIVMSDIVRAIEIMTQLRDLGCRISIDDFGTGYSSLSYLSRFPISSIKVDRSFVSRIPNNKNDMEIASAIIAMSHKLGLSVVAEGVETEEQKKFLVEQGCELLQGYLLERPKKINHFVSLGRQRMLKLVDKD